jgi:hypothetical protein
MAILEENNIMTSVKQLAITLNMITKMDEEGFGARGWRKPRERGV